MRWLACRIATRLSDPEFRAGPVDDDRPVAFSHGQNVDFIASAARGARSRQALSLAQRSRELTQGSAIQCNRFRKNTVGQLRIVAGALIAHEGMLAGQLQKHVTRSGRLQR
jgi:hypothetical protein